MEESKKNEKYKYEDIPNKESKHKNKNILLTLGIMLILSTVITVALITPQVFQNTKLLTGGEKVCVAEKCVQEIKGDAWAGKHCRPANDTIMCDLTIAATGENVTLPIKYIDLETASECIEFECAVEVYAWNT